MQRQQTFTERLTPGEWQHEPGDLGHSGSWEEPSDPGYPPTVFVEVDGQAIDLATINYPQVEYAPNPDDEYDPGVAEHGDFDANGRVMAGSKRMLLALQEYRRRLDGLWWNASPDTMHKGIGDLKAEMADLEHSVTGEVWSGPSERR